MKYIAGLLLVLLLASVAGLLQYRGNAIKAESKLTRAALQHDQDADLIAALQRKAAAEHAAAVRVQAVADQYEKEKQNAQLEADRVVADLRADNLRLRREWRGAAGAAAGVSGAAAGSGEPDAETRLREQGAADLVRAAVQCDAQVRGLQAIIEADRHGDEAGHR